MNEMEEPRMHLHAFAFSPSRYQSRTRRNDKARASFLNVFPLISLTLIYLTSINYCLIYIIN